MLNPELQQWFEDFQASGVLEGPVNGLELKKAPYNETVKVVATITPRGMTIPDAAIYVGASPDALSKACQNGELPYRMIGDERIIDIKHLNKWFESIPLEKGKRQVPKVSKTHE